MGGGTLQTLQVIPQLDKTQVGAGDVCFRAELQATRSEGEKKNRSQEKTPLLSLLLALSLICSALSRH